MASLFNAKKVEEAKFNREKKAQQQESLHEIAIELKIGYSICLLDNRPDIWDAENRKLLSIYL